VGTTPASMHRAKNPPPHSISPPRRKYPGLRGSATSGRMRCKGEGPGRGLAAPHVHVACGRGSLINYLDLTLRLLILIARAPKVSERVVAGLSGRACAHLRRSDRVIPNSGRSPLPFYLFFLRAL
jgi:hypothetical protein